MARKEGDVMLRVDSTAGQLVTEMAAGRLSAVEVLEACRQRVNDVNPALNALVVTRWDEARGEAAEADRAQRIGMPLGPLHGLPVSIKELFDVAGLPTTAGLMRRRSWSATRDAAAVERWRAAGAIVIGKTNVPQFGILADSANPVYGRTNHPWSADRSPGGSSGGEAALIAAGASPLGLASDGAGSIRQPAHACGICGLKPTGGRFSMLGHWLAANWPSGWAQPGPMARCVSDLKLGYQALHPPSHTAAGYGGVPAFDPREAAPSSGLRVGVYEQFEELPAMASVRRAVNEAASALAGSGIDVVPFHVERAGEIWDLFLALFYAEGLRDMRRQARGSPLDWRVRDTFRLGKLPAWTRRPAAWASRAAGQHRVARVLRTVRRPILRADNYCQLLARVEGLRFHFARQMRRARIDALLGPVSPGPAFRHDEFYATESMFYTGIYNVLGLPSGVVPVTCVAADEVPTSEPPREWVARALWRAQSESAGLPIAVQIVGPWWNEQRVLQLMEIVEQQVGFQAQALPLAGGTRGVKTIY
jgi:fatty acid amide hydrolase